MREGLYSLAHSLKNSRILIHKGHICPSRSKPGEDTYVLPAVRGLS